MNEKRCPLGGIKGWRHCWPSRAAWGILIAAVGATGCEGRGRGSVPHGETIVAAITTDIRGVNELTTSSTSIHTAVHLYGLFLSLLDEQDDSTGPPSFEPQLAESYEFSDDRKVLTFHLRGDVVWSDGEPLTAEDVRFTWEAQTHPEVAWSLADAKASITDVEVVDPVTVRFHFDHAYATQLLDANLGVILPRHAWSCLPFSEWRRASDWFVDHLVVSGPFELEAWEPGHRFVLRRNERFYLPGYPRAARIVFRVVPERMSQLAMLRSGEAHVVDWASPADAAMVAADPEIEVLSYAPRVWNALTWNTRRPLFHSGRVRRALAHAIDRQAIVDSAQLGYGKIAKSPFHSRLWAHNQDLEILALDPDRARRMLAEEGWTDSDGDGWLDKDGTPFRFEILTLAGNALRYDILVMVQEDLARVGVDARPRQIEFNTQLARERDHDFDASFTAMTIPTNLDMSYFLHTRAIDEGYNFAGYSNPEIDRLLDQLKDQIDQLSAKPLYDRLQMLVDRDQPLTFLYEPRRFVPIRKALENVQANALSTYFHLHEWELVNGAEHGR